MISLRQLQVFLAIARHASVSKAAESVHITQSAASMALAELEKQFDVQLFDRLGKRLVLNSNGSALLPHVATLLERSEELSHFFQSGGLQGELNIGASSTIGTYLLPRFLADFKQAHADVNLTLKINNTQQVIEDVRNFKLDVGYIEGICNHPDLLSQEFYTDELVIFARQAHPLALLDQVTLEQLAESQWIMRESGSGTRQLIESMLVSKLSSIKLFLEFDRSEAITMAVMQSEALSCLSRLCVASAVKARKLVILNTPGIHLSRSFYMILRRQKFRSQLLAAWLQTPLHLHQ